MIVASGRQNRPLPARWRARPVVRHRWKLAGALISAPRACGDTVRQPLGITSPTAAAAGINPSTAAGLVHVVPGHVGGRW